MDESYVTQPPTGGEQISDAESRDFVGEALQMFADDEAADLDNRYECLRDLEFQALRQWDDNDRLRRELAGRPTFVCDMLGPFIRQVDGELRRSPPSAKVHPGEDGDVAIADVMGGLLRSIHHLSFADQVFSQAGGQAAACGMGHFRLSHEFEDDTFLTTLRWRPINNPLAVIRDPDCVMPDHSDAKRCWVFDDMSVRAFRKRFPQASLTPFDHGVASSHRGWFTHDTIRVAECWTVETTPGLLTMWDDGSVIADQEPQDRYLMIMKGRRIIQERKVPRPTVKMRLMTGAQVLGTYTSVFNRIPIFTVEGEKININGEVIRRGIIRTARDPQIIRNWAISAEVETVALAPLQKWLATAAQIKGHEGQWQNANSALTSTLLYNRTDSNGNDLGKPERMEPPEYNDAAARLADRSIEHARQGTGLFAANLGQKEGGVTAGVAIDALQNQGETGSYLYIDNLLVQIQSSAACAVRAIPKIYDTTRSVRILGEDMRPKVVKVNDGIHDLNVGKYDCIVGTGPSFKTARKETSQGMREALKYTPPELAVPIVIRLAQHEDWPQADQIADEMRAIAQAKGLLPPAAGQAPGAPVTRALPTQMPGVPGAPGAPPPPNAAQNSPYTPPATFDGSGAGMGPEIQNGAVAPPGAVPAPGSVQDSATLYGSEQAPPPRRIRLVAVN